MKRATSAPARRTRASVCLILVLVVGGYAGWPAAGVSAQSAQPAAAAAATPAATPGQGNGAAATIPTPAAIEEAIEFLFDYDGAGEGKANIVTLRNDRDGRLRVAGRVQLNRIRGGTVTPFNYALAYSSCTGCQTLAVALQLNVYDREADVVAPEDLAVALNYRCTGCTTVARAIQYAFGVDDPKEVAHEVRKLISSLDRELRGMHKDQATITLAEAEARTDAVIDQFRSIAGRLDTLRDATTDPTSPGVPPAAPPSPTATPTPTAAGALGPAATPPPPPVG